MTTSPLERIKSKTIICGDCEVFQPGRIKVAGKYRQPHHVTYEHVVGSIPEGKRLVRTCSTPHCVKPSHYELKPIVYRKDVLSRLERHCEVRESGCVEYMGGTQLSVGGAAVTPRQAMWEQLYDCRVPAGMRVARKLDICRHSRCIFGPHLHLVPKKTVLSPATYSMNAGECVRSAPIGDLFVPKKIKPLTVSPAPTYTGNMTVCYVSDGKLFSYKTGEYLRPATEEETAASDEAAEQDDGRGLIEVEL